jgi:hypothetical protein
MSINIIMNTLLKPLASAEIIKRLKSSAKKRGIYFDLTVSDIEEIGMPLTCPILGIPLKWNRGAPKDDSYSFDRKDSSLGYVKDNIEIISFRANRAKNNLSEGELKKFSQYFG